MSENSHALRLQTLSASRKRKETEEDFGEPTRDVPVTSNWLLAGYMAHEFLTCGTMLGRKLYPGWAEIGPLVSPPPQHREAKKDRQSYADVACVFKRDGTHVPGVVNPTQLAKWIHM
ncbi:unnamed protein product [Cochlearia groenlandica]